MYATGNKPILTVATTPTVPVWRFNHKLTEPTQGYQLAMGAADKGIVIIECYLTVSQTSEITLYFGDGTGANDTFATLILSAGVPFVWSAAGKRNSGGSGDGLYVSWTAGTLYVNVVGLYYNVAPEDPYLA